MVNQAKFVLLAKCYVKNMKTPKVNTIIDMKNIVIDNNNIIIILLYYY